MSNYAKRNDPRPDRSAENGSLLVAEAPRVRRSVGVEKAGVSAVQDAAVRYAEIGWPIFPIWPMRDGLCTCNNLDCRPDNAGKHPITAGWQRSMPTTVEAARLMWAPRLGCRGIGLACGQLDMFVFDIDRRHGAEMELRRLLNGERLPATVVVATGDGWHYYFRQPEDFEVRNWALGHDSHLHTRGGGGYAVLPPSPHRSGGVYRWLRSPFEHEIAAAPDWMLERLRHRTKGKIVSGDGDDNLIAHGQRYTHLAKFAGLLRSCGVNERTLVECGLAFLRHQCKPEPPMDFEYAEAQLRKMHAQWRGIYMPPEER
jgi:bifunctional DNA primase/polymerase-like protein